MRAGQSAVPREDRLQGHDVGHPLRRSRRWRGPYPPEVFAAQFEKVAEGWRSGIAELQAAVERRRRIARREAQADLRFARAAGHPLSVRRQPGAFRLGPRLRSPKPATPLSPEERRRLRAEMKRCLESEIVLARQLFTLVREDSRIGFEPSCQYFYLPLGFGREGGQLPLVVGVHGRVGFVGTVPRLARRCHSEGRSEESADFWGDPSLRSG